MNKQIKVVHAVTVSKSLLLMRGQLNYLEKQGFETLVITSPGKEVDQFTKREGTQVQEISMEREISLFKDLKALFQLVKFLRKYKPHIVNAGTPKAGLLVTLAAWLVRIPIKIYTVRGLRVETTKGLKTRILMLTEKIACKCSDLVLAISPSLRRRILELNLASATKVRVIGSGSSNGIDTSKTSQHAVVTEERIKKGDVVLGFVGRITKDKGIEELLDAFDNLYKKHKNIKLLILGDFEANNLISEEGKRKILTHPNIIYKGFKEDPYPYYRLMDIFVFPTHREGFGNVSIEAALAKLPVVTTNATGAIDTIVDKETGFLYEVGNVNELENKVEMLIKDPQLRREMGIKGHQRVINDFSSEVIWYEMGTLYKELLQLSTNDAETRGTN